jgi:hypothetical protein
MQPAAPTFIQLMRLVCQKVDERNFAEALQRQSDDELKEALEGVAKNALPGQKS